MVPCRDAGDAHRWSSHRWQVRTNQRSVPIYAPNETITHFLAADIFMIVVQVHGL